MSTRLAVPTPHGRAVGLRRKIFRGIAGVVVLASLFLPLLTVRYLPPGGWGRLYGRRIHAFVDPLTGLQFATAAHWTHILPAVTAMVAVGIGGLLLLILRSWVFPGSVEAQEWRVIWWRLVRSLIASAARERASSADGDEAGSGWTAAGAVPRWVSYQYRRLDLEGLDFLFALGNVVLSVGWLLVIGLVVLVGVPSMPPQGEKGVLPAFQASPFSAQQRGRLNWIEPAHMSATLGLGWLVLLVGVTIGIVAMRRQVAVAAIFLLVALIALRFADRSLYDVVSPFLA